MPHLSSVLFFLPNTHTIMSLYFGGFFHVIFLAWWKKKHSPSWLLFGGLYELSHSNFNALENCMNFNASGYCNLLFLCWYVWIRYWSIEVLKMSSTVKQSSLVGEWYNNIHFFFIPTIKQYHTTQMWAQCLFLSLITIADMQTYN